MLTFSVVTSAYNAEEYLERAIDSVVGQSYKDFEYVIVDNGSTDNTRSIIQRYSEMYPGIVKGKFVDKNRGISGGRNFGIEHTTGKFICFLDADDYWSLNKLQVVKEHIDNHPDYNMFCHSETHIHNGEEKVVQYRQPSNACLYKDLLVNGNCLSTSAMIIERRLLVKNNGFDETLVSGEEDYDLWLRLANDGGKVLMINQPLGYWIIRDDSVSAKHIVHTEAVVKVVRTHFKNLIQQEKDTNLDKDMRKAIAHLYCGCGRTLSLVGNRIDARRLFKKSIECDRFFLKSYAGLVMNFFHV